MLKSSAVFLRFIIFWLIFFLSERTIFLFYFSEQLRGVSFTELVSIFLYSIRLDLSLISYLAAIPLLYYCASLLSKREFLPSWLGAFYQYFFIVLFSLVSVVNLNLYKEWGEKLNYRALDIAISSPREAAASAASSPLFVLILYWLIFTTVFLYIGKKLLILKVYDHESKISHRLAFVFLTLGITALCARGGWQLSPANPSMAYFSTKPLLNHTTLNTEWNLVHDIISNKSNQKNPYLYYPPEEADQIVSDLYEIRSASPERILAVSRPNIVLIILESFTAEFVQSLGGEKGVNPKMEEMISQGVLFDQIYASAGRTDKGLVATISAFPSQAVRSVMKQNNKQEKLPGLAQEFSGAGYQTSFYYGGESEFFNMKSYILSHGYRTLIDEHSFEKKDMNSKWGAFDHVVFNKNLADLDKTPEPFFSTILTLTNHEPFEIPGVPRFPGENIGDKFRSTAAYTDSCLGAYIQEAKKRPWYKNTLFIVLADHGHRLPRVINEFDPDRYRIPLLMAGEVLKPERKGTRISKIGSQTDLAKTLLNQLEIPASRYRWSKDLLDPNTRGFAFFSWNNGFGLATDSGVISYDNIGRNVILRKGKMSKDEEKRSISNGQAYMQSVFQQYLDL